MDAGGAVTQRQGHRGHAEAAALVAELRGVIRAGAGGGRGAHQVHQVLQLYGRAM
jgi:hypothetical protein